MAFNKSINFYEGHILWSPDSVFNIGVDNRFTNNMGDGLRPRNIFAGGLIASGNLYNDNAPYGLNGPASLVGGIFAAGNGLANTVAFMGANALFGGVQQGYFAFSKDTSSANSPGFFNSSSASDFDITFSLGRRFSSRIDIMRFANSGSFSFLNSTGANLLWNIPNSGDIGSPDGGTTLETPQNIYLGGFIDYPTITTPSMPQASRFRLYFKTDGPYYENHAGVETKIVPAQNIVTYAGTTTLTTFTSIATIVLPNDLSGYYVNAKIVGRKSDGSKHVVFKITGNFNREGAGSVQTGPTSFETTLNDDDPTYDVQFLLNGNNVDVQAHGNASSAESVDWTVQSEIVFVS